VFFNLRLQDIDRVEILRGPQGTLYGSGSLGGTIRYVQNAPDVHGFDANAQVGVSDTAHTHTLNRDVSGMLNVPLSDSFALRLNAGYSGDAGFINQPNLYALNSAGEPIAVPRSPMRRTARIPTFIGTRASPLSGSRRRVSARNSPITISDRSPPATPTPPPITG